MYVKRNQSLRTLFLIHSHANVRFENLDQLISIYIRMIDNLNVNLILTHLSLNTSNDYYFFF